MSETIGVLLARRWVFRGSGGVAAARPVLAWTAYFEDARAWAAEHAPRMLTQFLSRWGEELSWFRTSRHVAWRTAPAHREELVDGLRWSASPRHQFRFEVVDRRDVPSLAFRYHEVDSSRRGQCGYAQVILPLDTDPDELLGLAIESCQTTPLTCAHGGLALLTSDRFVKQGYTVAFGACRRFLGLDLPDPEAGTRIALSALPSVSWLTFVSDALISRAGLDPADLATMPSMEQGAQHLRMREGSLIKAGAKPELGDVNMMEYPRVLAAVSVDLDRLLAPRRPLGGPFSVPAEIDDEPPQHTEAWLHRFAMPEAW